MTDLLDSPPLPMHSVGARTLIDSFVELVKGTSYPAFTPALDRAGEWDLMATSIGLFLPRLDRMYNFAISVDADAFGERLRIFRDALQGIEIDFAPFGTTYMYESEGRYLLPEEVMNLLIKRIRERPAVERPS
ncbi:hypothetical protein [Pseudomonas aeruginosa]